MSKFLSIIFLSLCVQITSAQQVKRTSEKDMKGYLMVYFKDDTHSVHFALSNDGYTFTALNDNKPVIAGDTIATQKGIRDPFITRGKDGYFYMAATDLHIFGKENNLRTTQWERPEKDFGWGNNQSLVLMRSKDLINWSHHSIRIDKAFAGFENIGCAWAPELIYDDAEAKMMIYFTLRFGSGPNQLYYAYVNEDFKALSSAPKTLFQYPKKDKSAIDADIFKFKDKYKMFYVAHDGTPGIKMASSANINSGYVYDDKWYDPEPKACEAPTVWKRINEDKWVLMYDIYGINPHNFGFSETTDFVNFTDLGHFNEGVMKTTNFTSPKHGAVIHLTKKEINRLQKHWNK